MRRRQFFASAGTFAAIAAGVWAQPVEPPATAGFGLRTAMIARLDEPVRLAREAGPATDRVLILVMRYEEGRFPLGGGAAPDPIWFVDDRPARLLAFDPPDLVLIVEQPEDPGRAMLWRYDPMQEAAQQETPRLALGMPEPARIKRYSAEVREGARPGIAVRPALVDSPAERLAPSSLAAIARRMMKEGR